jgi:uncharacterized ubiquitin-like protein YukD
MPHLLDKNPDNSKSSKNIVLVKVTDNQLFYVEAFHAETIGIVKVKIQDLKGYRPEQIRLIHASKALSDECTLSVFNIRQGDMLHLCLELEGGGSDMFLMEAFT